VRSDRRAAMCVENIFFKTKKLQMKILLGTTALNAGVLKQGAVERLIHLDEGFKYFSELRGSPLL